MLRKCTEKDKKRLLDYLEKEPALNLFTIGDIEMYGFESSSQDVWCYENEALEIEGVLLRYKKNLIPTHSIDFSGIEEFISLIRTIDFTYLSGKQAILKDYQEAFPSLIATSTYFAECQKLAEKVDTTRVEDLEVEGISEYFQLMRTCFNKCELIAEEVVEKIKSGKAVMKIVKNQAGKIVAGGEVSVESQTSGMIIGVGTLPEERGHGFASAVVSELVNHCHEQGKSACLFYHNPIAGKIYKRLGFQDLDQWMMLKKK